MLKFGEYWMSGIEVKAGEPTDIWFGAIRLGKFTEDTSPSFTVYHQESGKKVGSLMGGRYIGYTTLPVLAGMYVLRSQGRNDVTVVVEVGKTVIVEEQRPINEVSSACSPEPEAVPLAAAILRVFAHVVSFTRFPRIAW